MCLDTASEIPHHCCCSWSDLSHKSNCYSAPVVLWQWHLSTARWFVLMECTTWLKGQGFEYKTLIKDWAEHYMTGIQTPLLTSLIFGLVSSVCFEIIYAVGYFCIFCIREFIALSSSQANLACKCMWNCFIFSFSPPRFVILSLSLSLSCSLLFTFPTSLSLSSFH